MAGAVTAAALVVALTPASPQVSLAAQPPQSPAVTQTIIPTNTTAPTKTAAPANTATPTNTLAAANTATATNTPANLPGAQLTGTAQAEVAQTQSAVGATFTAAAIIATFQATSTAGVSSATAAALTATASAPTATLAPTDTAFPTDTPSGTVTPSVTPAATATPNPTTPHDSRYFSQTGFRLDDDTLWNYFNIRGGLNTFGYPTSREFLFQGFQTQFFQRRIMQFAPDGGPRLLNLFDGGLFPYTAVNGSTFPAADPSLVGSAPQPGSPTYAADVARFVQQNVPDAFNGKPVGFFDAFKTL